MICKIISVDATIDKEKCGRTDAYPLTPVILDPHQLPGTYKDPGRAYELTEIKFLLSEGKGDLTSH